MNINEFGLGTSLGENGKIISSVHLTIGDLPLS